MAGLAWSIPERVPDHKEGHPEYDYDYDTDGNYEDDIELDYGDPPEFAVPSQTFTAKEGDAVTMPCTPVNEEHLSDQSHYTLIIKKMKGDTKDTDTLFLGTSKVVKDSRIKLNGGQLEISKLRRRDAGVYVCYFENPTVELRHTLVVQYAARTTRLSDSIKTVGMKDPYEFRCEAEGNPAPKITWSRADGAKLPLGHDIQITSDKDTRKQSSLSIVIVDRHVEGVYICEAQNGIGQPSKAQMTLRVSYPPEIVVDQFFYPPIMQENISFKPRIFLLSSLKIALSNRGPMSVLSSEVRYHNSYATMISAANTASNDLNLIDDIVKQCTIDALTNLASEEIIAAVRPKRSRYQLDSHQQCNENIRRYGCPCRE
ncbi:unnamed protein product, partial [Meganyctiphanes norvegica]